MKIILTWVTGVLLIIVGYNLIDFGIIRVNTDNKLWLGILQMIFGVAFILDGYKKVEQSIL